MNLYLPSRGPAGRRGPTTSGVVIVKFRAAVWGHVLGVEQVAPLHLLNLSFPTWLFLVLYINMCIKQEEALLGPSECRVEVVGVGNLCQGFLAGQNCVIPFALPKLISKTCTRIHK